MKITIIGAGNVGGTLAKRWADVGHQVIIGVRDKPDARVIELSTHQNITSSSIKESVTDTDVILVATPAPVTKLLAEQLGDLNDRVLVDATNSISEKPEPYKTGYHAFKAISHADAIKCFNTTGFETMNDPVYNAIHADMYMAGGSAKAKLIVTQLAKEIGFGECYDFGGDDKVELIEHFAMSWINLALIQGNGRGMTFKVLKR